MRKQASLCLLTALAVGASCSPRPAPTPAEPALENKASGVVAAAARGHLFIIVQGNLQWMGNEDTDPEYAFPGAYKGVRAALDQLGKHGGAIDVIVMAAGPEPKELFRGPLGELSAAALGPRDWFANNIGADLGAALRVGRDHLDQVGASATGPRALALLGNGHSVSEDFAPAPLVSEFRTSGIGVYTIYFDAERRTPEGLARMQTLGFTRSVNATSVADLGDALSAVVDDAF